MKARIVENLLDVIEFEMGAVEGHRKDPEFLKLVDRIQGLAPYNPKAIANLEINFN